MTTVICDDDAKAEHASMRLTFMMYPLQIKGLFAVFGLHSFRISLHSSSAFSSAQSATV